jgi:hypothetical protein
MSKMRHLYIPLADSVEEEDLDDMMRILAGNQIAVARKRDQFTVAADAAQVRLDPGRRERSHCAGGALDPDDLMIRDVLMVLGLPRTEGGRNDPSAVL